AVGASGALCGILTSMGVWVYLNRNFLPPNIVSSWMNNVITNIVLITLISILPGLRVSWEGHLGGALAGVLVSVPLNYQRFGSGWQKAFGLVGILAVPVLSLGIVVHEYWDILHLRRHLYAPYREAEARAATVFFDQ